ncbi:MAG TPA: YheU family protein [Desulfuromonadaceae bacterium]
MEPDDVLIQRDEPDDREDGVEVPWDRINSDTLRTMVEEFVTREWSELADAGFSLEVKVEQVLQQLRDGRAKVVYDQVSETCNIVPTEIR